MLVGSVSALASTAAPFTPVLAPQSASGSMGIAASPSLADSAAPTDEAVPSNASADAANPPAGKPGSHAAAAPADEPATASPTTDAILNSIVSGYSTTVAGTQYMASLEQSGAEYTASVQQLLGATATDATEVVAENNLNLRINELV